MAKSICRNIEFCELFFLYSPNFVTNTFDEFTKGNAPVSSIVFKILFISTSEIGLLLITSECFSCCYLYYWINYLILF